MNSNLNAEWITGFVDGEGCFRVSILKNKQIRSKIQLQPEFVITQHKRDYLLLKDIQSFFKCGHVSLGKNKEDTNCYRFRVRKLEDLCNIIIPFFDKHELKTKKQIEFVGFRDVCFLLKKKIHLTEKGFDLCLNLASQIPYKNSFL